MFTSSIPALDSVIMLVGDILGEFPPAQYVMMFARIFADFMRDRMALFLVSFLLGMVALLAAEFCLFWRYFIKAAILPPPKFEETSPQLPEVLKSRLEQSSLKQKDDSIWLNFLLQFLFSELKDSLYLRRFLTKKIQLEFEEVLRSRSGVLVDELFLRDFSLGDSFPVILGMSVERSDVSNGVIQTLNLKARVAYDGGFQIAIDAALPFHRMAFVSVTVLKLRGVLRLQFTQLPFSHWSMSFYEEPELEMDVTAQLDGRPMPKLRNIIANQIRKIIRRKHTLPMYKLRYKPFFQPRLDPEQARDGRIHIDGAELGLGILEVTIIEASRLPFVVKGAKIYCTVSVDELPWKDQRMKERRNRKVITVELIKNSSDQSLGMTVKDELLPDRLHPAVMIGDVSVGTPAHMAGIQQGDILVGVGGTKVTSAKQAMKNLKWAKDRIQVQIERADVEMGTTSAALDETLMPRDDDGHNTSGSPKVEDYALFSVSQFALERKVNSWHDGQTSEKIMDTDLFPVLNLSTALVSSTSSPKSRRKIPQTQLLPEGRRTTFTDASVNPYWNHKFVFSVDSAVNYLNVCLWSKGGDRSGKPEMISSTKQDVLLGFVSLNLDEIYLHCLITLNGTMQDRVKLKHGHYKTEDELIKTWSVHKGWDLNQMYGDLSLGFHYVPTGLTEDQRRGMTGSMAASSDLQNELFERYKAHEDENRKPSPTKIAEDHKRDLNEGHHQFGSATFMTATFCDFCGKKIWMKEAFKCKTCSMVCHKKCLVKCLVSTICTDAGVKKRTSSEEVWEIPSGGTTKLKSSAIAEEVVRNYGIHDDDVMVQDGFASNDVNMNTSESMLSLATVLDTVYNDPEQKGLPSQRKQDSTQEVNPVTRFRGLKEQTDRMKDNVLKHLRRNKVPAAFNDKAIMSAKEIGARLFVDMDPSLRKDRLEDLVKKLDQELKAEMENKESIEQELTMLEVAEQKAPNSKRKSDVKSLSNKMFRSVEKQDAMRLLMLQYCSGLQNCINSLEAEVSVTSSKVDLSDGQQSLQQEEPPKVSRSAAVGGFVRRASSSVKERMSFIKKDFGKKGLKVGDDDKPSTSKSINNSGLNVIEEIEDLSSQDSWEDTRIQKGSEIKNETLVEDLPESAEVKVPKEVSEVAEISTQISELPSLVNYPAVEICVDEVDTPIADVHDLGEVPPEDPEMPRSSSDSTLEINKMLSLKPEEILRYRGTSMPRLSANEDTDSDSDYLVIDSSDEPVVTDTSDSENDEEGVGFKGRSNQKKPDNDDSDDSRSQHRGTLQQLQTFQV